MASGAAAVAPREGLAGADSAGVPSASGRSYEAPEGLMGPAAYPVVTYVKEVEA